MEHASPTALLDTWTPLGPGNIGGRTRVIRYHPTRPDTLFAAGVSGGVWRSDDGGDRISRASGDAAVESVLSEPGMGRTSLAIAPSDPNVVYAMSASNEPGPGGQYRQALLAVYRSTRGGDPGTWETRVNHHDPTRLNTLLLTNVSGATARECGFSAANTHTNMGWYVNVIAIDPRDPDRVWAGGVDWFRSDDGGRNWGLVSSMAMPASPTQTPVHVDQHGIAFHPSFDGEGSQTVIVATDGGLYRSHNARARATASEPTCVCSSRSMAAIGGWSKRPVSDRWSPNGCRSCATHRAGNASSPSLTGAAHGALIFVERELRLDLQAVARPAGL